MSALPEHPKWRSLQEAVDRVDALRAAGNTIALTNGCFDLLHPGHIYLLNRAAEFGGALFVALNSCKSIQQLKGPNRPIQTDRERAYAVGSLEAVDTIFTFDTPRLVKEIQALKPEHYCKAGDYTTETLDASERQALEQCRTDTHFIPYLQGYSTTQLINFLSP